MRLLLLEALLCWQAEFNSPPLPAKVEPSRFWQLGALIVCVEIAVALWISGALRPLSTLY